MMQRVFDISNFDVENELSNRLGFKKIFNLKLLGTRAKKLPKISDKDVMHNIRAGAIGVLYDDYKIDNKLISELKNNESILYIPIKYICVNYGFRRTKSIYFAKKLFEEAMKNRLNVGFVSFADNKYELISSYQLIEMAKLIGAKEDYARNAITTTNAKISKLFD